MTRWPLVLAVSLVVTQTAFAQTPFPTGAPTPGAPAPGMPPRDNRGSPEQKGTAVIRGRVIAAESGQPLRRASVALSLGSPGLQRRTTTDAEGRYEFVEVAPGQATLTASKGGYVNLQYGQRRPFEQGTPLPVQNGQTLERIDFALPKGGVMLVRVTDDFGEPVTGARIQVQRYQYQPDGQRRLTAVASSSPIGIAGTDDVGEMRVHGLMPGEYLVSASMTGLAAPPSSNPNDAGDGLSTTFFPGVIGADSATPVSVGVGQLVPVQFSMIAAKLARVSGIVVSSDGNPLGGMSLSLVIRTSNSMSSSSAGTTKPDGTFAIGGVAPGEYTIDVRPPTALPGAAAGIREGASFPIAVGGADLSGVRIVTSAGTRISGRVVWDGTSSRDVPGLTATRRVTFGQTNPLMQMMGQVVTDSTANGTLDADGRFAIAGAAGRVFFNVTPLPPSWVVKSVTMGGRDITDEPIDLTGRTSLDDVVITMTDKLTSVSGQVADGRGQVLRDYVVVIQPAEDLEAATAARRVRAIRPNADGRFETRGLRPGRYFATAVDGLESGREFSPEFRQQLRQPGMAREFTVRDAETVTLDLRLTPGL